MTSHAMPLCTECELYYATSFDPDGSMMCGDCRAADDEPQATEAGDPDKWIVQGDTGELMTIYPSVVTPPIPAPAAWIVSTAGEVTVPVEDFAPLAPAWISELVRLMSTPIYTAVFLPEAADFIDTSDEPLPVDLDEPAEDVVNHPSHYTSHPSGVECITITEHMGFNLGNAVKYIWRCDLKRDAIEDLKKAAFYVDREIAKRERELAAGGQ
ncbi:hypothetical protein SEA_PAOLA_46 [Mycobacterium phage Paola]|uniref:DUF3310 domain-containing protein n=2 Tax=Kratiovirus TaxID=2948788 RepID=A0A2R4APV2_9CAUD|nr:hypothetical protein I5G73_gp53 [Mycobacterium phage Leston]YP_009950852.1 hypothetical protein I5G74_gp51 [Mycobacterium phage Paola]ASR85834.1 hypothetical protein SEA_GUILLSMINGER_47 [Mycobacterium phage Guillsminger]AVO25835.1 hypothetical protein SEA_PAOLA_46 [Mycobacterium phage Paola]AVR77084.1 hypothetical protein SEA_LESTON_46 [Mycobacterium phage Leston]